MSRYRQLPDFTIREYYVFGTGLWIIVKGVLNNCMPIDSSSLPILEGDAGCTKEVDMTGAEPPNLELALIVLRSLLAATTSVQPLILRHAKSMAGNNVMQRAAHEEEFRRYAEGCSTLANLLESTRNARGISQFLREEIGAIRDEIRREQGRLPQDTGEVGRLIAQSRHEIPFLNFFMTLFEERVLAEASAA